MSTPSVGGAREQVARLLTLVPYLHGRGSVELDRAAADLGVPPRQLVKDLKVLLMCGLPGGLPDDLIDVDLDALEEEGGDRVIRVSNADYLARPLRLTPTEATAIIVALRALRESADEETRPLVDRTLAKLEAAASDGLVDAAIAADDSLAPPTVHLRAELERAVAARRQVRLTYYVPARDEESERVVDPRGVVGDGTVEYLDAWCHTAEAPRLFRLDRIHAATVLDEPIATEPQPPRDLSEAMFASSDDADLVTLRLEPPARWVTEYYAVEGVRPAEDGTWEVDLLVADRRWLQRLLLRLAPHAVVVRPEGYEADLRIAAEAALRLYDAPGVR